MNSHVTESDIGDPEPTRRLSRSLAAVVSALGLDQPIVVTANDLAAIADAAGIRSPANVLAARLRKEGWLLPGGVWEFAPAAHAGPYGHGDPFLDLRVLAARYPDSNLAVAGTSAMWALGYLERHGEPVDVDVTVARGTHIPAGLTKTLKATTFEEPRVPTTISRDVTVLRPASIVVHVASQPNAIRWKGAAAGLAELFEAIDADQLEHDLVTRPRAVRLRTAYLVHGGRPDLAHTLTAHDPPRTWFGPRGVVRRYASRFGIADTLLLFDPADLAERDPTP